MAESNHMNVDMAIDSSCPAPMSPSDALLVGRLYREHAAPLRRYLAARFGSGPPEPEEVAQAAFAKFAGSPRIAELKNPRSFLFTIACNIVLDHHRRAVHRDAVHRDIGAGDDSAARCELTPERVLLSNEKFAVFERALKAMPTTRRRIFLLARVEGLGTAIVAQRFGITESAVHKHVSRALADCANAFAKAERCSGVSR